jgi:XTP/dITP diphosphohydrolase
VSSVSLPRLVVASANRHKLAELRSLLEPRGLIIVSQTELGIDSAEETASTFAGNALLKARHAATQSGHWALADDSGICVAALNGAPGVYSARFAGIGATDQENNHKLISTLQAYPQPWEAHYTACLVLVSPVASREPIVATANWHGHLIATPRGVQGFGYDPYFVPAGQTRTAAEFSAAEKHSQSHRAQALARLLALWPDDISLSKQAR